MASFVSMVSMEPAGGALPSLFAATSPDAKGGDYYSPNRLFGMVGAPAPARSSGRSKDMADARRLWEESERLTGVAFSI